MTALSRRTLVVVALCASSTIGCPKGGADHGPRSVDPEKARSALTALSPKLPFAVRTSLRRYRGPALIDTAPSIARETALGDAFGRWVRACKTSPLDAFDEVIVGVGPDRVLVVAELAIAESEAMRCLRATFDAQDAQFQEHQAVRLEGRLFALPVGRLLLVGDEASVTEALDLAGEAGPLASCLALGGDEFLAACGKLPPLEDLRIRGKSVGELSVAGEIVFSDASGAAALKARLEAAKQSAQHEAKFVRDALDTIVVEPRGRSAQVRFGTAGDDVAQSGYLLALAMGLQRAFWEEKAKALANEARTNVTAIAQALRDAASQKGKSRGPVFPEAPPAVPTEVPRGIAYTPTERDFSHATWATLGFSPKEPIRYQYEVSITGRRATVRARGDLDGNGRHSLFEIAVDAKPGGVSVSPLKVVEETE